MDNIDLSAGTGSSISLFDSLLLDYRMAKLDFYD